MSERLTGTCDWPSHLKPIKGFESYYLVDIYGGIYSIRTKRFLRWYENRCSRKRAGCEYAIARLKINKKLHILFVHRLVAQVFVENPLNKPEVNHKDGDRWNNHFSNLEWVTSSENSLHAIRVLGTKKGPRQPTPEQRARGMRIGKFTTEDILFMRLDRKNGLTYPQIARKYNTSLSNAQRICKGETWKHLPFAQLGGVYNFKKNQKSRDLYDWA